MDLAESVATLILKKRPTSKSSYLLVIIVSLLTLANGARAESLIPVITAPMMTNDPTPSLLPRDAIIYRLHDPNFPLLPHKSRGWDPAGRLGLYNFSTNAKTIYFTLNRSHLDEYYGYLKARGHVLHEIRLGDYLDELEAQGFSNVKLIKDASSNMMHSKGGSIIITAEEKVYGLGEFSRVPSTHGSQLSCTSIQTRNFTPRSEPARVSVRTKGFRPVPLQRHVPVSVPDSFRIGGMGGAGLVVGAFAAGYQGYAMDLDPTQYNAIEDPVFMATLIADPTNLLIGATWAPISNSLSAKRFTDDIERDTYRTMYAKFDGMSPTERRDEAGFVADSLHVLKYGRPLTIQEKSVHADNLLKDYCPKPHWASQIPIIAVPPSWWE